MEFEELVASERIAIRRGPIFDVPPAPLPQDDLEDRVRGMMLGLAIGDALGNTSEGQSPAGRRERCGEIIDYLENWYANDRPCGLPSDDTQLAFWTLEHLIEHGHLDPERLADVFASRPIFGIGGTVSQAIAHREAGEAWYRCGPRSAGNGALMRIAPMVIPFVRRPSPALWSDTARAGMITHNDPASISACVAFVAALWDLLGMTAPPAPQWWVDRYLEVAAPLEGDARYEARGGDCNEYAGPVWRFVAERLPAAQRAELSTLDACESWFSGAFLLETVPCVYYILMRHAHDPEEAIVRAVNDTRDNDTIAAIVGAAVGALHGERAFPRRWREGLLGRLGADDDGAVFDLLDGAVAAFL